MQLKPVAHRPYAVARIRGKQRVVHISTAYANDKGALVLYAVHTKVRGGWCRTYSHVGPNDIVKFFDNIPTEQQVKTCRPTKT